jgi:hydrogenase-4 component E
LNPSVADLLALGCALAAILATGSTHLRMNIRLFALQTFCLAIITGLIGYQRQDMHLMVFAIVLFLVKTIGVPAFLQFIIRKVNVLRDSGTVIPSAMAMLIAFAMLVLSYFMAMQLPVPGGAGSLFPSATAAISLVGTGLLLMLTRRIALSQIIGFLVMENGIYLFGLMQTHGMPMMIELGVMLDVLVSVMVGGLLAFQIKKDFEHIDVTLLSELRE